MSEQGFTATAGRAARCFRTVVAVLSHRSRAGSERELTLLGVPACARCASIVAGAAFGGIAALLLTPPLWIGLAVLPALVEAMDEKVLRGGHRPRRLIASNVLAGGVIGGGLVTIGRLYGGLALAVILLGARALSFAAKLSSSRARPLAGRIEDSA